MANRHHILQQARNELSVGHAEAASRKCAKLLLADPRDVEARHLNGRCYAALGHWSNAAAEFGRVLSAQPGFYPALVDMGIAQAFAGNYHDSRTVLEAALAQDARPAELHFGLGVCRRGCGDLSGAAAAFQDALTRNPQFPDAQNNLGLVYDELGRLAQAVECFQRAVAIRPDFAAAHRNLGDGLLRLGQPSAAAAAFQQAAALRPGDAVVHAELGAARLAANDIAGAIDALERALSLDGRLADAAINLGEALRILNAPDRAAAAFRRALALKPDAAEAHLGLGKLAAVLGNASEATSHLLTAAQLKPDDPRFALIVVDALDQLGFKMEAEGSLLDLAKRYPDDPAIQDAQGAQLHRKGDLSGALACYERALAADGNRPDTLLNRGRTLESMGSYKEAIESIERSLAIRPAHTETVASLASCAVRVCDWKLTAESLTQLRNAPDGIDFLHPFLMLATDLEPSDIAQSLKRRGRQLGGNGPIAAPVRYAHDRLRVAYVSPDFREHPVAHALAGIIDRHDRQRLTPIAVSLTTPGGAIGLRLRSAFDEFIDASSMSDLEVASQMRQREIDVAIDLAGHTTGARPAIFSSRAARVQINYLGFPGSMGADFMDYIIADEVVLPRADDSLYSERVLRMPNCYLPFDSTRPPADPAYSRIEAGLPPQGFVFCAFNNGYKITRDMFEVWMSLLRDVPDSILWLRSMDSVTSANLASAAIARNVAPERLVVAPFVDRIESHVTRLQMADLFLDTVPYNAHTTASEALWAGVPVISCRGRTFAGRVGASVLTSADLPELICADLDGYRARALDLARSPAVLENLRERVRESRKSAPVFDTERYTRDLEALLRTAHESV